ncbi:MAG: MBL fold metallo-hydrolase [Bryobacteraceae bacterium]|jgi:beta-lactamase superfamily II metal-dependent hydrolase
MRKLFPGILLLACAAALPAARNLEIYSIDVEGGQATLLVSLSGESMLVDTGWAGFNHRDAERIAAAAKAAGVKKIDYLVITHYHADHVGGVPQLAEKLPIRNFVDHGAQTETTRDAQVLYNAYIAFRDKGNHIQVKPGDVIPIKGIEVKVLSSAGDLIGSPLPGAGQPDPECASFQKKAMDTTENGRSVGMLISWGSFRMIDLADLTWNKEYDLVCPNNKIGAVDLYLVSHHGLNQSGSPQLVHALHPRVALMNNGARKGGAAETWQTIHDSPGLLDLWQLHYAVAAGKDHNSGDPFIANVDELCEGKWIRVTVRRDGSFTVYNSRNKYEKTYTKN